MLLVTFSLQQSGLTRRHACCICTSILWYESTCSFPGAIITLHDLCMRSVALSNHLCLSVCLSVNLSMTDDKISIRVQDCMRVNLHMLTWYMCIHLLCLVNTLGRCSSYLWKLFVYITNAINTPPHCPLANSNGLHLVTANHSVECQTKLDGVWTTTEKADAGTHFPWTRSSSHLNVGYVPV